MKSPCTDVCVFDRRTGWCRGCGRTVPEVRAWKKAQPHQLRKISTELPRRLAALTGKAKL